MNYLTMDELAEFLNFNIGTVRIFLQHFTLSKHVLRQRIPTRQTRHNPPHKLKTAMTFRVNGQSVYDLEKYLNMKGNLYNDFEKDIREYCKLKRASDE